MRAARNGGSIARARVVAYCATSMSTDPRKAIPVPAAYLRSVLKRFGDTPEQRAALLAGADFDEQRLRDAAEVTLFTSIMFVQNLCRVIGEDWPLRTLEAWSNAMQGALEVAMRSAPTVRESMEVLARYGHVRGPQFVLRLNRERSRTRLTITPAVAMPGQAWRSYVMTGMLSIAAMLDAILEGDTGDVAFEFGWESPPYAGAVRAALPGAVRYSQPGCAIVVTNAVLDRPSPFADPSLLATAVGELERASLRVLSQDALPLRVDQLLRSHTGRLTADEAARLLGLSRRTLVRRLAECGVTFRGLHDSALKQRAGELLSERRMSRAELAEALGFSDPTSFSRARRRWFQNGK